MWRAVSARPYLASAPAPIPGRALETCSRDDWFATQQRCTAHAAQFAPPIARAVSGDYAPVPASRAHHPPPPPPFPPSVPTHQTAPEPSTADRHASRLAAQRAARQPNGEERYLMPPISLYEYSQTVGTSTIHIGTHTTARVRVPYVARAHCPKLHTREPRLTLRRRAADLASRRSGA